MYYYKLKFNDTSSNNNLYLNIKKIEQTIYISPNILP